MRRLCLGHVSPAFSALRNDDLWERGGRRAERSATNCSANGSEKSGVAFGLALACEGTFLAGVRVTEISTPRDALQLAKLATRGPCGAVAVDESISGPGCSTTTPVSNEPSTRQLSPSTAAEMILRSLRMRGYTH